MYAYEQLSRLLSKLRFESLRHSVHFNVSRLLKEASNESLETKAVMIPEPYLTDGCSFRALQTPNTSCIWQEHRIRGDSSHSGSKTFEFL